MRCCRKNQSTIYYCTFKAVVPVQDSKGYDTLEKVPLFNTAVAEKCYVSPATGSVYIEMFGTDLKYDRVLILDDPDTPIDENTVLFVDKEPSYDESGIPLYDYVVKRVARFLQYAVIAIRKAEVTS